jgi:competence protein ComEA
MFLGGVVLGLAFQNSGGTYVLSRFLTTKEQWVLLALAAAIGVGGIAVYTNRTRAPTPVRSASKRPAAEPEASPVAASALPDTGGPPPPMVSPVVLVSEAPNEDRRLSVSVAGAVMEPGLYELDTDARVQDIIDRAGGALPDADLSDINLAALLIDGSTLTIPSGPTASVEGDRLVLRGRRTPVQNPPQYTLSGWRPSSAATGSSPNVPSSTPAGSGNMIDLNYASPQELESLPGIGPKLAAEIVQFRANEPFQTVDDLIHVSGIGPKKLEAVRSLVTVRSAQ